MKLIESGIQDSWLNTDTLLGLLTRSCQIFWKGAGFLYYPSLVSSCTSRPIAHMEQEVNEPLEPVKPGDNRHSNVANPIQPGWVGVDIKYEFPVENYCASNTPKERIRGK